MDNNENIPVLSIILAEIKSWVARNSAYDKKTIMSINEKTAFYLIVLHIAIFLIAKGLFYSWAAGQATCLMLSCMALMFSKDKSNNIATFIVPQFIVSLIFIPIVVIVGMAKTGHQDFIVYVLVLIATLIISRLNWKRASTS